MLEKIKPDHEKHDFEQMLLCLIKDKSMFEIGVDGFYENADTQAAFNEFSEIIWQTAVNNSRG